jgi:geranylgeranyl diphosphate synthase type II
MIAAAERRFVETMLDRYKAVTMDALLKVLPAKEPRRYLYDLVPLYPLRAAKGLRPGLCIATCGAFGGLTERAVRSAVAIELYHNAFLVHDDVEDGSEFRRGQPTLPAVHGVPIAVNVGDAMNALAIRPLMDNLDLLGPTATWRVFAEVEHMARESVEGQAMELGWVRDNVCELTDDDYLRMTLKKTCWYTCIHPCRIGSLVATGGAVEPERFDRFGYYMGAAFQIQDDVLNLVGDAARYGKEIDGDILEGKRTLSLIHLLNSCSDDQHERLRRFLGKPRLERTRREVNWARRLMDRHGSIDYARNCAKNLAGAALHEFLVAYGDQPDTEHKHFIEALVLYMIARDL